MPKYALVEEAARHCWSKNYLDKFREFYEDHADIFINAPQELNGEQNLEYYSLFQKYLVLYENTLSDYIESLNVSTREFFEELNNIKDDKDIKDKKLLYFVDYLVASTDYPSFYKVMIRAAKKKAKKNQEVISASFDNSSDSKQSEDSYNRGTSSKSSYKDSK